MKAKELSREYRHHWHLNSTI